MRASEKLWGDGKSRKDEIKVGQVDYKGRRYNLHKQFV
jgi:hypothetical protein